MSSNKFIVIKWSSVAVLFVIYYILVCFILPLNDIESAMRFKVGETTIYLFCLIYCVIFFWFLSALESFQIEERRILDLIFGFFLGSVCVNLISGLMGGIFTILSPRRVFALFLLAVFLESLLGLFWILFNSRVYEKVQFCREAVFIYGSREDETEYTRFNSMINRFFQISRSVEYQAGMDAILEAIQTTSVVFLGDIPVEIRNPLIKYCMSKGIACYSIPKISDIYIQNASVMQLHDKLLLRYPKLEITGAQKAVKRLMDILVSLLMLALFSPVMAVIAIAVKLDDAGPVFYFQDRVTQGGRPFRMYKFRSMKTDAEKDGIRMTVRQDARVTRVGRVIRNIHFDELPQLVNVLKGEMSLVGPRPERMEYIRAYAGRIPEFPERLRVRGGLTGYAQVYGRYNTEPEDKIKYDLYYIYNYSLRMDVKILLLTIRILFQKENTEGVDENDWVNPVGSAADHEAEDDESERSSAKRDDSKKE